MKRHELDITSLFSGIVFAGAGVVFALKATGTISLDLGLVPALAAIAIGVAICASVVTSLRRPRLEPAPVIADDADSGSDS